MAKKNEAAIVPSGFLPQAGADLGELISEELDGLNITFLTGFDEQLWNCTVESMTVLVGGGFRVRFKDRLEVEVPGK